jgi:hypothetical protein
LRSRAGIHEISACLTGARKLGNQPSITQLMIKQQAWRLSHAPFVRPGLLLILPLLLIAASLARAQAAGGRAADSAYISQGESEWAESMTKHNASALDRILADDFIEVGETGELFSKAEAVRFEPSDLVSNQVDSLRIRFYGDVAIAFGGEAWTKKDGSTGRNLWTDTWVRRQGKWQIVASAGQAVIPTK